MRKYAEVSDQSISCKIKMTIENFFIFIFFNCKKTCSYLCYVQLLNFVLHDIRFLIFTQKIVNIEP